MKQDFWACWRWGWQTPCGGLKLVWYFAFPQLNFIHPECLLLYWIQYPLPWPWPGILREQFPLALWQFTVPGDQERGAVPRQLLVFVHVCTDGTQLVHWSGGNVLQDNLTGKLPTSIGHENVHSQKQSSHWAVVVTCSSSGSMLIRHLTEVQLLNIWVFTVFNQPTPLNIDRNVTEMMKYSGVSYFFWECMFTKYAQIQFIRRNANNAIAYCV